MKTYELIFCTMTVNDNFSHLRNDQSVNEVNSIEEGFSDENTIELGKKSKQISFIKTSNPDYNNGSGSTLKVTETVNIDPNYRARWRSLWLATIILFLVSVQFSLYFSSLWPYLIKLDPTANETFFGFIVAAYSLGQMIASPLFAKWSNSIRQIRIPVAFAICFTISGNFVYVFVEAFDTADRKWILLGTRFVMGLAGGCTGILRAYVATASKLEERHRAIAQSTGAYSLGLTAGPIIQAALSPIGYPAIHPRNKFFLNAYTAPAYLSIVCGLILLGLLLFIFREHYDGVIKQTQTAADNKPAVVVPKFDKVAAFLCIWFWFTMFFCITNIETIESPYTMAIYNWTSEQAVFYNGLILGCSGFLSFCSYFIYACYGKRFIRERLFITVGLCMLGCFYVFTYPWPFYTRKLYYKDEELQNQALSYNGTLPPGFTTITVNPNTTWNNYNTTKVEPVGCEDNFDWCRYTPWVPPEVYFCSYPLLSIGFPTINVALSTLYSKILGPRRQSTMQSMLIMAGSFARLLGPIFISTLFQLYGPRIGWAIIASAVTTSIFASLIFRKRLVPLDMNRKLKSGENFVYGKGILYRF